jgi:hypothetical protein
MFVFRLFVSYFLLSARSLTRIEESVRGEYCKLNTLDEMIDEVVFK